MVFPLGDILKIVNLTSVFFLQKENANFNDIPFRVSSVFSQLENSVELCKERVRHIDNHEELLFFEN